MIKIQNNTATREPIPVFLQGLSPESLADLSWTDPQLGVQDCAWWQETYDDLPIDTLTHKYGDEILTINEETKTVSVTHEIVALTQDEIDANYRLAHPTPNVISMRQARLQLLSMNLLDSVNSAIVSMPQSAQIEWEYATEVRRDNALVLGVQSALSMSDLEMDTFFTEANKL